MSKTRVIIESPLKGNVKLNKEYARICLADCLERGEAPYASHLLYTQVLDDTVPEQRRQGMEAGFAWNEVAEKTVVYVDLGVSGGMKEGIKTAIKAGRPWVCRRLFPVVDEEALALELEE